MRRFSRRRDRRTAPRSPTERPRPMDPITQAFREILGALAALTGTVLSGF
ncbi:hypothetical protein ACFPN7_07640 [Amycolatopsis halotolerans]